MARSFNPSPIALKTLANAVRLGLTDTDEVNRIINLIRGGEVYAYNAKMSALARLVEKAEKV